MTEIEPGAFDGCRSLTTLVLPDSLTSIGRGAFNSCSALTSLTIPHSVEKIDSFAFRNCSSLKKLTLPPHLPRHPFLGCPPDCEIVPPMELSVYTVPVLRSGGKDRCAGGC